MSSINKVVLMGRLGADPEIRRTQDGRPIVNLSLATSETWRDKATGERRERTEWHRVVVFNEHLADVAEKYLHKGDLVHVEGMLCTRSWEGQDGQKRYATEVVLKAYAGEITLLPQGGGEGRKGASSPDDYGRESGRSGRTAPPKSDPPATSYRGDLDDDIPF